jgi:hypothetical protein
MCDTVEDQEDPTCHTMGIEAQRLLMQRVIRALLHSVCRHVNHDQVHAHSTNLKLESVNAVLHIRMSSSSIWYVKYCALWFPIKKHCTWQPKVPSDAKQGGAHEPTNAVSVHMCLLSCLSVSFWLT